jgi:MFS family permease
MITLATYGVGMLIGFWVAGQITENFTVADGHLWKNIWLFPAAFALAVFVLFTLTFSKEKASSAEELLSQGSIERG